MDASSLSTARPETSRPAPRTHPRAGPRLFSRMTNSWVARWISPLAILALWQVSSASGVLDPDTLAAPTDIVSRAWALTPHGPHPHPAGPH